MGSVNSRYLILTIQTDMVIFNSQNNEYRLKIIIPVLGSVNPIIINPIMNINTKSPPSVPQTVSSQAPGNPEFIIATCNNVPQYDKTTISIPFANFSGIPTTEGGLYLPIEINVNGELRDTRICGINAYNTLQTTSFSPDDPRNPTIYSGNVSYTYSRLACCD